MSSVDRAWLLMDRPANPMMIVGLIVLGEPLGREPLRQLIGRRFLDFERFRRAPVGDTLGGRWVETPGFNLDDHLLLAALPAPGGQRELEALAGELASTPLPPGRPLWSFHLIERYGGGSAIIVRIHHCYADGVALVQVLLSLADRPVSDTAAARRRDDDSPAPSPGGASWARILKPARDSLRWGAELLDAGMQYALRPEQASGLARQAVGIGSELLRLAMLSDDPPTRLKRALSGIRRIAWAQALSLEEVHTIGRLLGCTVNDVLIATLAGALGRYLESEGEPVEGLTIRAAIPVNLKPVTAAHVEDVPLGNRFGLVFADLPIGVRHPLERLYAVHAATRTLKSSSQPLATFGLLALVGSLPAAAEEYALGLLSAKVSLVASNLPGPVEALTLGGCAVRQVLFWVPQYGSVGAGVSMFTYCGRVHYGVMADRELIADPGRLVALLAAEFERLVLLVLLGGAALEQ